MAGPNKRAPEETTAPEDVLTEDLDEGTTFDEETPGLTESGKENNAVTQAPVDFDTTAPETTPETEPETEPETTPEPDTTPTPETTPEMTVVDETVGDEPSIPDAGDLTQEQTEQQEQEQKQKQQQQEQQWQEQMAELNAQLDNYAEAHPEAAASIGDLKAKMEFMTDQDFVTDIVQNPEVTAALEQAANFDPSLDIETNLQDLVNLATEVNTEVQNNPNMENYQEAAQNLATEISPSIETIVETTVENTNTNTNDNKNEANNELVNQLESSIGDLNASLAAEQQFGDMINDGKIANDQSIGDFLSNNDYDLSLSPELQAYLEAQLEMNPEMTLGDAAMTLGDQTQSLAGNVSDLCGDIGIDVSNYTQSGDIKDLIGDIMNSPEISTEVKNNIQNTIDGNDLSSHSENTNILEDFGNSESHSSASLGHDNDFGGDGGSVTDSGNSSVHDSGNSSIVFEDGAFNFDFSGLDGGAGLADAMGKWFAEMHKDSVGAMKDQTASFFEYLEKHDEFDLKREELKDEVVKEILEKADEAKNNPGQNITITNVVNQEQTTNQNGYQNSYQGGGGGTNPPQTGTTTAPPSATTAPASSTAASTAPSTPKPEVTSPTPTTGATSPAPASDPTSGSTTAPTATTAPASSTGATTAPNKTEDDLQGERTDLKETIEVGGTHEFFQSMMNIIQYDFHIRLDVVIDKLNLREMLEKDGYTVPSPEGEADYRKSTDAKYSDMILAEGTSSMRSESFTINGTSYTSEQYESMARENMEKLYMVESESFGSMSEKDIAELKEWAEEFKATHSNSYVYTDEQLAGFDENSLNGLKEAEGKIVDDYANELAQNDFNDKLAQLQAANADIDDYIKNSENYMNASTAIAYETATAAKNQEERNKILSEVGGYGTGLGTAISETIKKSNDNWKTSHYSESYERMVRSSESSYVSYKARSYSSSFYEMLGTSSKEAFNYDSFEHNVSESEAAMNGYVAKYEASETVNVLELGAKAYEAYKASGLVGVYGVFTQSGSYDYLKEWGEKMASNEFLAPYFKDVYGDLSSADEKAIMDKAAETAEKRGREADSELGLTDDDKTDPTYSTSDEYGK